MFGASTLNETLLIPPSYAPGAGSQDPAAPGTPPASPRKRFFKTRRWALDPSRVKGAANATHTRDPRGSADRIGVGDTAAARCADDGTFLLHEKAGGASAVAAAVHRAKRVRRTAEIDPVDDSITHTHFINPVASIDTTQSTAALPATALPATRRQGRTSGHASSRVSQDEWDGDDAGSTAAQQLQQQRDQDAFDGDMEATVLAARKLNFDGVTEQQTQTHSPGGLQEHESSPATAAKASPRRGTVGAKRCDRRGAKRCDRQPSPLARAGCSVSSMHDPSAGSPSSSAEAMPSLPDDLAQHYPDLSLFDLGGAMTFVHFGAGVAPAHARPRASPRRRKVRRHDPDDLWATEDANESDSSSGDQQAASGGGGAMLSPSNTHLAPIINAESEAIVNHGPSKHFSMLQRAATKAGAARPVWEGWLTKQGAVRRNWKRRWCILDEAGVIRYYKPSEYIPRGVVTPRAPPSTVGDGVVGAGTRAPAKLTPVLSGEAVEQMTIWPADSGGAGTKFAVQTESQTSGGRTFFFFADTVGDANKWTGLIKTISNRKCR